MTNGKLVILFSEEHQMTRQHPLPFRFALRSLFLFAVCSLPFAVAHAQSTTATLSGTVEDQNGAAIPGVTVTVVNKGTQLKREATTNQQGDFAIPLLPPGGYTVRAQGQGFAPTEFTSVVLNVGDQKALKIELKAGDINAQVRVNSEALLINESPAVATVIDRQFVSNLPLNGRSFQDLILLTPGVSTQSPSGRTAFGLGLTGEFSVNGQRTESNNYFVDGVSANVGTSTGQAVTFYAGASGSLPASTALGTTQALVSVDALQEFRVQSSTFSAEYGRLPGGQFTFVTKSGTDQLHGSGFEYYRNGALDAQDWFNNYFGMPQLDIRQHDFGGTLGGPVRIPRFYDGKHRTFFFFSYEGLRLVSPQPATATYVPDTALRVSAPGPLKQVLNAYPFPTSGGIADPVNGFAQYVGTWSNPSSLDSASIRLDHVVNSSLTLFFRFSRTTSDSATRATNPVPTVQTKSAYTMQTYTTGVSSILSRTLTNDFRLNYSSNVAIISNSITALGGSTPVDLGQLTSLRNNSQTSIFLRYGGYNSVLRQGSETGGQKQWNVVDTLNLSAGPNQFKFGVDYRRLTPFGIPVNPSATFRFTSRSGVMANTPLFSVLSVFGPAYPLYNNFSAFAQDDLRLSQRLNLSFGLRWEVNPAPDVTRGSKPYTIQGSDPATWSLAPQGTALWQTTWRNFAPRVGLAYVLRNGLGRETVVRGGAGLYFDTGQQLGSLGFSGAGFIANAALSSVPFPTLPAIPAIADPPKPFTYSGFGFDPHLQLPYTIQWNASIEQAMGTMQALTLSYVGSHGARLLAQNLYETPANPNARAFTFVRNRLTSDYNALEVQFLRRLSKGLSALGSYTWSHCLDYGSTDFDYEAQRGNCDFDIRHNLSAAISYDLPLVGRKGNAFQKALLSHWGFDGRFTARSAFPITLFGDTLVKPDGQDYYAGLNLVPGQPIYLYGDNCTAVLQSLGNLALGHGCPGNRAINPQAFSAVSSGLGNAPRNFARLFGAWQVNMAIQRDFVVHERLKLQFRIEAFNIFNHPNFGRVDPFFGSSTFGQATSTLANSLSGMNALYQQGGPRSMQFSAKILF